MAKRVCVIALVSMAFAGCAEKSDPQQVTDAVKAEVSKRGDPSFIRCIEARERLWDCVVVLLHSRLNRAYCLVDARRGEPVIKCSYRREGKTVIL
jgi:hypothetical protein